ncbi:MAG: rhodanese-like domain-containing protein [Fibrobacter sp.]|nr:rhodanese-like domain-containing protein [Fibrobacter sp.]
MQIIQKCKRPVFAFDLILFFIIGIVCSSQQSDSLDLSAIVQLTPQDASELVNDTSVTILDVRTINEYKVGHIGKAIVIPVQELQERVSEIEHLKNSKVLVYCRTGVRSKKALQILQQNGFSQLYHLEKGIRLWTQEGFKIE